MDILSFVLAKSHAVNAIDAALVTGGRGMSYRGAVNYLSSLPASPTVGDCYTVKYTGSSGTEPNGAEYVWGEYDGTLQWIELGGAVSSGEGSGTSVTTAQPDWLQNDSTAADYVKNRPFYIEDQTSTQAMYFSQGVNYSYTLTPTLTIASTTPDLELTQPNGQVLYGNGIKLQSSYGSLGSPSTPPSPTYSFPLLLSQNQEYNIYLDSVLIGSGIVASASTMLTSTTVSSQVQQTYYRDALELFVPDTFYLITQNLTQHWTSGTRDEAYEAGYIFLPEEAWITEHTLRLERVNHTFTYHKLSNSFIDTTTTVGNINKPVLASAVYNALNNKPNFSYVDSALSNKVSYSDFDDTPTRYSQAPVTSDGIFQALANLQTQFTNQIAALQSRVATLEQQVAVLASGQTSAGVQVDNNGNILTGSVEDDWLIINDPAVSVVDGIITSTSVSGQSAVTDGDLVITNTQVSVNTNGILTANTPSIGVTDNSLNI